MSGMEAFLLKYVPQALIAHLMSSSLSFCSFLLCLDDVRKLLITSWRIASLLSLSQYMIFYASISWWHM